MKADGAFQHKRLVLCFDGTAKTFAGDQSDSNVVKIYQMLDRKAEEQYHYYQPGIGTYIQGDSGYGWWHDFKAFFQKGLDQALGLSFRDHVIAGYEFIMRYYSPGDYIYIFGFSRGAYTARFLSEMLKQIGLLSRGNEEMVSFAWKTFSEYQTTRAAGSVKQTAEHEQKTAYMADFKKTFCRDDVDVYFLGLFDCVNSVGQFASSYPHIPSKPAKHIRHAVSINERRVKFKPALFSQAEDKVPDEVTEMWFAGAHGDIGGGWPARKGETRTLSSFSLKWMLNQILNLPDGQDKLKFDTFEVKNSDGTRIQYNVEEIAKYESRDKDDLEHYVLVQDDATFPEYPKPHDELYFGRTIAKGITAAFRTMVWRFMEHIPLFSYLVYRHKTGKWQPITYPPNRGALRDIPDGANIHPTVNLLYQAKILEDWEVAKVLNHKHSANGV